VHYLADLQKQNKTRLFLILNGLALSVYFFIALKFGYLQNLGELMFWSNDANKYKEIADWVFGLKTSSTYIALIPLFYPLLLGVMSLGGVYLIWFVQFAFWLVSINLIAYRIGQFTGRNLFSVIAFVIFSVNISLITLTFHALTETLVLFLSSLWLFVFFGNNSRFNLKELFILTLLLSLLAVTKPVYQLHLGLFLMVVLAITVFRRVNVIGTLVVLVLALIPVIIQLSIMANLYHSFGLSKLSGRTMKDYYFSKVYMQVEKLPTIEAARQQVIDYDDKQIRHYLYEHPRQSATVFVETVVRNMVSGSNFIDRTKYYNFFLFTVFTNLIYFCIHIILLPVTIRTMLFEKGVNLQVGFSYIFFLLILFGAGFSFFQGDRLIVTSLPLWLITYAYVQVGTTKKLPIT
jgi:hypothetical protein